MTTPLTGMSAAETEALLAEVTRGAIAPKTAIALMTLHGEPQREAARRVFYALGGSDTTELDEHGRLCYTGSGKLVAELERTIAE